MPKQMKNRALKVPRPNDFLDSVAAAFGNHQVIEKQPQFVPTTATRPQRMLLMADMHGIEHSLAAAVCDHGLPLKTSISLESMSGLRYGLQIAEGLKIVDDHTTFGDPRPRLSESEDLEEVKDSIFEVMEDELVQTHLRLVAVLAGYDIHVQQQDTEVDPVQQALAIKATTTRPVEQLNSIMSNMKVRRAVKGHAAIRVTTDHTIREFVYQDDRLVGTKPDDWDKGTNYNAGDFVNMPGANGTMYRCVRNFSMQSYRSLGVLDKFWKGYDIVGTETGRMRGGRIAPA